MKQQFNVMFVHFAYGGNGGISSEVPDIREWQVPLVAEISKDPRIENIRLVTLSDTPITMTRNRAIVQARQLGVDVLVMVDSDMKPDVCAGQPDAKPFFQTAFDFLCEHYPKGPCVIGAPYCGPPPVECVYVFRWQNQQSDSVSPDFQLEMYDRHTAAKMSGIQECAALPTGLIMFDMRAFDLIEPRDETSKPFTYYEWKDKYAAEKASTEDVTLTRDISLIGTTTLGYNPVYCNWDAWAGHWKPKLVGKPVIVDAASVGGKLKQAWESKFDPSVKIVALKAPAEMQPKLSQAFDCMGMELVPADVAALKQLIREFKSKFNRAPIVLEIGSWAGKSAITMIEAGAQSVHCVDDWEGNEHDDGTKAYDGSRGTPFEVFKRNVAEYPISYTCGSSPEAAAKITDGIFDIVYIDAEHTCDAVKIDVLAWAPKSRCWIAGHDYAAFPDVAKALTELGITPKVTGNVWRCDAKDVHKLSEVVPGN